MCLFIYILVDSAPCISKNDQSLVIISLLLRYALAKRLMSGEAKIFLRARAD